MDRIKHVKDTNNRFMQTEDKKKKEDWSIALKF